MNIRPLGSKIIIEKIPEDEIRNGIVIPNTASNESLEAKVVAVSSGRTTKKGIKVLPSVNVGDTILYGLYRGEEVDINDKEYLIIEEDDVIGIL